MECLWDSPFMKYELIHFGVDQPFCYAVCEHLHNLEEGASYLTLFWFRPGSLVLGGFLLSEQTVRTKPPRSARTRARAHSSLTNFSVLPFGLKSERRKKAMEEASTAMRVAVVLWQRSPITQCQNLSNYISCSMYFHDVQFNTASFRCHSNFYVCKFGKIFSTLRSSAFFLLLFWLF